MIASRPHAIGAPGYSETLPCEEKSASRARRLITAVLNTWGLDCLDGAATVIVSDLATNAIAHGRCHSFRVGITLVTPGRVRVAVSDRSTSDPEPREPSEDEESGRGLLLVASLADRWGVDRRSWGKVVWAELAIRRDQSLGADE
ncbi:ATP-binding protein [Streptomyces sp. SYSU K217416]